MTLTVLYHMILSYSQPPANLLLSVEAERCGSAAPESGSGADAVRRQLQPVVRCCAGVEERPRGSLAQEARAYGQGRGVIPFSCAYFAADASTRGRTSA
jgi:hypothetical protein